MNALVTGSTGFIGSHLVEELIRKNYDVYCFVRKESDLTWLKTCNVQLVSGSYSDTDSLQAAVKDMDYIFHVAAVIDALDWETYYKANVEATVNLLDACIAVNPKLKKFVFVSSISAAGPATEKKPINEDVPCHPVSLYGKSKKQAEEEAEKRFHKLPVVIIRPTNVMGIRQKQLLASLKLAQKRIIPLIGNGDKQTSICFVQDVVRSLVLAAENQTVRDRIYFIANKEHRSWREILSFIARELGAGFTIQIPFPMLLFIASITELISKLTRSQPLITRHTVRSTRKNYWLHDCRRIEIELGFTPAIKFEPGLKEIIQWYRREGLL